MLREFVASIKTSRFFTSRLVCSKIHSYVFNSVVLGMKK